MGELLRLSDLLKERDIELHSLNENIDTTSAGGKLIFHIFAAMAQFERDLISERTKAGLKAARARGARGGRKPKVTPQILKVAKAMLEDPTVTMDDVSETLKISKSAIYRNLKKEEMAAAEKEAARIARAVNKESQSLSIEISM